MTTAITLTNDGHIVIFINPQCLIFDNKINRKILSVRERDSTSGLYRFKHKPIENLVNNIISIQLWKEEMVNYIKEEIYLWHQQYGHLH